jgi:type IV pilus assembly protein PilV
VNRHRGFTLVEALVALVVLSIGLLGVAALQLTALRNNSSASFRSQATYLAYDIADRMRANRDRALAGNYDVAYTNTPTGATLAERDVAAWKTMLTATLPSGDGSIQTNGVDGQVVIRIQWDDSRSADAGMVEFVTRTRI